MLFHCYGFKTRAHKTGTTQCRFSISVDDASVGAHTHCKLGYIWNLEHAIGLLAKCILLFLDTPIQSISLHGAIFGANKYFFQFLLIFSIQDGLLISVRSISENCFYF